MTIDPKSLRDSLETILAMDDAFPARFYSLLFERHPEVKKLFHRSSPTAQQKMFAQKICAIVDHVDDPAWLGRELHSLRENHDKYGVTPEMYPWVGEVLIDTLREALGDAFSPELEANWREAYGAITKAVLG